MALKSNKLVFDESVKQGEAAVDLYYRNDSLVVSGNPSEPNQLMLANIALVESITAYKVAMLHADKKLKEKLILSIRELLRNTSLNLSEFVSYWSTLDVSYSGYKTLSSDDQAEFLRTILESYIADRHSMYALYGYTHTTLQVRKDSIAHKASGSNGLKKLESIFLEHNYTKAADLSEFLLGPRTYIFPDGKDKKIFKELISSTGIVFGWSALNQGKKPDAAFLCGKRIFLLEHKHKKEGGGGQNGQLTEIISFVESKEIRKNVHYVSFLDGIYFNELTGGRSVTSKVYRQLEHIKEALKHNKNNYFVNTAGLKSLLKDLG